MATLLLAMIGLSTGILSGVFGVGGGFVLVPLLELIGWPMPQAVGTSLLYVTLLGIGGSLAHLKKGNLDLRLVLAMALPAILGAQLGALGTSWLPASLLQLVFAGCTLFAAGQMASRRAEGAAEGTPDRPRWGAAGLLGLTVGVLSGLLGVGGGLFLVPGQVRWLGVPLKRAIGNSLAAIVLTGASGVEGHLMLHHVQLQAGAWLVAGGLVGLQGGLWMLERFHPTRLRRAFVAFLAAVALSMGVLGVHALAAPAAITHPLK
jgi:uncharacterized membrane protein YfcA